MYSNIFTLSHPGLVIFIVDKSISMNEKNNGISCIEVASKVVNTIIDDLISRDRLYEVCAVFIEHDECVNARVIQDWFSRGMYILDFIRSSALSTFDHGWPRIESHTGGVGKMTDAFELAFKIIYGWNQQGKGYKEFSFFPTPLIINISNGKSDGLFWSNDEVPIIINKIRQVVFPDGNPLVCNILIQKNPMFLPNISPVDDLEDKLYRIASVIPHTMMNFYNRGYVSSGSFNHGMSTCMYSFWKERKLIGKERLFVSSIDTDLIISFCRSLFDFYNMEWCGMCVGEPNPLLLDDDYD